MNDQKIISLAEQYLIQNKVEYVRPGEIGERNPTRVEVIFLVPLALDPNVVIDPPDVRVWVDIRTGNIEFIPQM